MLYRASLPDYNVVFRRKRNYHRKSFNLTVRETNFNGVMFVGKKWSLSTLTSQCNLLVNCKPSHHKGQNCTKLYISADLFSISHWRYSLVERMKRDANVHGFSRSEKFISLGSSFLVRNPDRLRMRRACFCRLSLRSILSDCVERTCSPTSYNRLFIRKSTTYPWRFHPD